MSPCLKIQRCDFHKFVCHSGTATATSSSFSGKPIWSLLYLSTSSVSTGQGHLTPSRPPKQFVSWLTVFCGMTEAWFRGAALGRLPVGFLVSLFFFNISTAPYVSFSSFLPNRPLSSMHALSAHLSGKATHLLRHYPRNRKNLKRLTQQAYADIPQSCEYPESAGRASRI